METVEKITLNHIAAIGSLVGEESIAKIADSLRNRNLGIRECIQGFYVFGIAKDWDSVSTLLVYWSVAREYKFHEIAMGDYAKFARHMDCGRIRMFVDSSAIVRKLSKHGFDEISREMQKDLS